MKAFAPVIYRLERPAAGVGNVAFYRAIHRRQYWRLPASFSSKSRRR
jgi:hypothetical protein